MVLSLSQGCVVFLPLALVNEKKREEMACFFTVLSPADEELAPLKSGSDSTVKKLSQTTIFFSFWNEQEADEEEKNEVKNC